MLNAILTRWARTRGALSSTSSITTQPHGLQRPSGSFPPPRSSINASNSDSLWQTLLRRKPAELDPWAAQAQMPDARRQANVTVARVQFQASLQGLSGETVEALERSICRSRNLRDLWHLRAWLYTEVARAYSQHEAERRLQALNSFFCSQTAMLNFSAAGPDLAPAKVRRH